MKLMRSHRAWPRTIIFEMCSCLWWRQWHWDHLGHAVCRYSRKASPIFKIKHILLAVLSGKGIIPLILKVRNRCRQMRKLAQLGSTPRQPGCHLLIRGMLTLLLTTTLWTKARRGSRDKFSRCKREAQRGNSNPQLHSKSKSKPGLELNSPLFFPCQEPLHSRKDLYLRINWTQDRHSCLAPVLIFSWPWLILLYSHQ